MKGNGNSIGTLLQKLYFFALPSSGMRTKFIRKHSYMFRKVGGGIFWQPRELPADPELISIGENVKIAANVVFINHDVIASMLNKKFKTEEFLPLNGCIEIGNNVVLGSGVRILPNVRIGSNVIIGSGAIVTKDIPDNCVAAGVPCRVIGDFNDFVEKRKKVKKVEKGELWQLFYESRKEDIKEL